MLRASVRSASAGIRACLAQKQVTKRLLPQTWLLLTNKRVAEVRPKPFQTYCITKGTVKWDSCFHTKHIEEHQYSIEYACRILNTLYDEHIHLQREIGVEELDHSRPSLIEFLEHLIRNNSSEKVTEQLERFNLRINQLGEINSKIARLEVKLDYLKEKQYLIDIERKLVRTEKLANNIHQQAVELRDTQENLRRLLETLISRIG